MNTPYNKPYYRFGDPQMVNLLSLNQFISEQLGDSESLSSILNDIISACKEISYLVNKGDLNQLLGDADSENIQGEVQKKLDIITHDIFVKALINNPAVAGLASEENDEIIPTQISTTPKENTSFYLTPSMVHPILISICLSSAFFLFCVVTIQIHFLKRISYNPATNK